MEKNKTIIAKIYFSDGTHGPVELYSQEQLCFFIEQFKVAMRKNTLLEVSCGDKYRLINPQYVMHISIENNESIAQNSAQD